MSPIQYKKALKDLFLNYEGRAGAIKILLYPHIAVILGVKSFCFYSRCQDVAGTIGQLIQAIWIGYVVLIIAHSFRD